MSKERLEEIKNKVEQSDNYAESSDWEASDSYIIDLHNNGHINWLIEQAERVQEFEETLSRYETVVTILKDKNKEIRVKNKHYREIIQDFIDYAENYNITRVEKYYLRKALEGEADGG